MEGIVMKKVYSILFFAAATLSALVSCKKEAFVENTPAEGPTSFVAYLDADATKTSIDGLKVCWEDGDEVSINGSLYVAAVDAENPSKAVFTLKAGQTAPTGDTFRAHYPASADVNAAGQYKLQGTQTYDGADVSSISYMYAQTSSSMEGAVLNFKHVCGLLALDIKGTDKVTMIKVSAPSGSFLYGTFNSFAYNESTGEISYSSFKSSGRGGNVYLDCGSGVQLSETEATRFYIAVPEKNYSKLGIEFTMADGKTITKESKGACNVVKGKVYTVPMVLAADPLAFTFTQADLKFNSVTYTTSCSQPATYYYTDLWPKAEIAEMGGLETVASYMMSYYLSKYTAAELLENLMDTGDVTYDYALEAETEYTVFAFAVDADCNIISTVFSEDFTSPASPYAKAVYEDFLGKFLLGTNPAEFSERTKGQNYYMTGNWETGSGEKLVAQFNSDLGCLEIYEQTVGQYKAGATTYTEYLSGVFNPGAGYYYGYPFNGDAEKILSIFKNNDGTFAVEAGTKLGRYDIEYFDLISYDGDEDLTEIFDYPVPSVVTPYHEASEAYKAWLGTWTVTDAAGANVDITFTESVPDELFNVSGLGLDFPVVYAASIDAVGYLFNIFQQTSTYYFVTSGITNEGYVAMPDDDVIAIITKEGNSLSIDPVPYSTETNPEVYATQIGILGYKIAEKKWTMFSDLTYIEVPATASRKSVSASKASSRHSIASNFMVSRVVPAYGNAELNRKVNVRNAKAVNASESAVKIGKFSKIGR